MRFDVTIYLPQTVKTMHIQSNSMSHIKLDGLQLQLQLARRVHAQARLQVHAPPRCARAATMRLRVTEGWLVGDATPVGETPLVAQDGNAVLNVRVHSRRARATRA